MVWSSWFPSLDTIRCTVSLKISLDKSIKRKINLFSFISQYSTASTSDAAYIFGGYDTEYLVAEFRDDRVHQWTRLVDLNKRRYAHGSITVGTQTMIVGGHWYEWVWFNLITSVRKILTFSLASKLKSGSWWTVAIRKSIRISNATPMVLDFMPLISIFAASEYCIPNTFLVI